MDNYINCTETRAKVLYRSAPLQMCRCEEKVKERGLGAESLALFKRLNWSDGLCGFIYSSNLHAILNKCFAGISLILKLKAVGIYAQSLTEIQLINMTFPKLSGFIYFSKNFQACCFKIPWLFTFFHDRMNPECEDRVRLSKSDKNIGAGGWRVDNLFVAPHSADFFGSSGHL